MSKNIDQVYISNPITSNISTDLMYFGQSPYGLTNDAAMTFANFAAQFLSATLTSGHIFVGNVSNVATNVAMSGDATLANTGALTLANTAVTPAAYTVNGQALFTVDSKGRITSASNATVTAVPSGSASGDLGGTYPSPSVLKINGVALGSTAATSGNLLIGSGTQWVTQAMTGDATINSSGALTLANTAVSAASYTVNGQALFTVDAKGRLTSASNATVTAVPSGSAGGDLSSTYPNPTVSKINGVALGSTTATSGNLLIGSGTQWVTQALSGDALITNAGVITVSKIGGVAISLAGSFTTSGAFAVTQTYTGITNVTFPTSGTLATTSQLLSSPLTTKGDLWGWSTTNARLPVGTSDGQVLQVSSGAATGLAYSTATYPTVATSTGSFIYANGTNYVASTSLWPNTVGSAGKIILSDGTSNVYSTPLWPTIAGTAGSVVISDGTNKINSTSLWPNTVGTVGKIVRSDGTTNAYTTSTFADTYGASTILYSNGANTVTGLATANSSVLVTTSAGVPVQAGTMTNGQMIIGSTGATPVVGTITASGNITATVGAGTFALSLTGLASFAYNNVSGTTQSAAINNGYIIGNASQTTVTLPATAAQGSIVAVQGSGAGGWVLTANTGQTIKLGSSTTSSAGSLTSTNQYDAVEVVCIVANTTWAVKSVIGNITVT